MRDYKILILGISITIVALSSTIHAKKIFPSDIMGRSLDYPGMGWLGHVGIATRPMMDSSGMSTPATLVIEILNEPIIGQINTIENFKRRSPYWGSKYGVIGHPEQGYRVLVEANHQRWWVSEYTDTTDYRIGQGNPRTGEIAVSGRWRCDTYAWWAYYSQGADTMPGHIWLPRKLFDFFPFFNDERLRKESTETFSENVVDKSLDSISTEELNEMPLVEFQKIIDAPPSEPSNYVAPMSGYMRFAYDSNLNVVKRGAMIDKITSKATEIDLVPKLLKLYDETDPEEVKNKIVSGLMFHVQGELREHPNPRDKELLRYFFHKLIGEKLNQHCAGWATMGFIDTHTADETIQNLDNIDTQLAIATHSTSIMLKYKLVHKSKVLQPIYIRSIIDELREANNSDLDSYFFGPLAIGYQGTGRTLLEPESKQMVINYLNEVRYKYTSKGIKANPDDFHRGTTAPYYFELREHMGI
ncbi:Uncharacterised protein (plasmid) [Legionella adelaidensis]|uniref:Uncharacterized protein n=1 Tax=Legionella adelaidensis TaxID=45056 RepID=A0A0W0R3X7_9GAMM|nr:hypothetical protein [Legionella adelaidensis]KTC65755.1 hypothetical protein Lade_0413 [Legionella adelaidensis]VEH85079.1 Uncharacterised protein [Legionella adelaidensis]